MTTEQKQKQLTYDELIEKIRADLNDDKRFGEKLKWIKKMVKQYSEKLGFTEVEILSALEARRDYWSANFYQEANFPSLDGVDVYANTEELMNRFKSRQFVCPICKGISTNPYKCNSGIVRLDNKVCDWKVYGLFRTMGAGYRFTVKDKFLENPIVDEIFMPVELAEDEKSETKAGE